MRVMVWGRIYPDSFARNIAATLSHMGHETYTPSHPAMSLGRNPTALVRHRLVNYAQRFFPRFDQHVLKSFVREARSLKPDLVIVPGEHPPPSIVKDVRASTGAVVVQWMSDSITGLGRQYTLAAPYDHLFFKDRYMVRVAQDKLGRRAHYLPQACNPLWHKRVSIDRSEEKMFACDLAVAGNLYWYRALMLEPFNDYDLKIWGVYSPRWLRSPITRKYQGHYVAEGEKAKAYSATNIVLNTMHYAEIEGSNLRLFEAAGCGAFQLVDWGPAIDELFQVDSEIITFRHRDELKEKVDYYLQNPKERQDIADRAYKRAHRDHTYEKRLSKLIAACAR